MRLTAALKGKENQVSSLPKDNLAYPVLISLDTGVSGTGCYIRRPDGMYFATAKHVLVDNANNLRGKTASLVSYTPDLKEDDFTEITLDLTSIENASLIKYHPTQDVCLVRLTNPDTCMDPPSIGVTLNKTSSFGLISNDINKSIKLLKDVQISNDVYIFGYPSSIGIKSTPQFNTKMPLLRKGIVAGTNNSKKTIIIDCPVYPGNSGGPVIEVEKIQGAINYKLIGLVIEFVPVQESWKNLLFGTINTQITNSGYSIVVPVDFIHEVLNTF
jgi:hypothetical protein